MRSSIDNDEEGNNLPKYKIIVLGKTAVGKTKLLIRYLDNFYEDQGITTIAVDFRIKKKKNAAYWYYDTVGQ